MEESGLLAHKIARRIPATCTALIDISNIRKKQLEGILAVHKPVFVSTYKTYMYRFKNSDLPDLGDTKNIKWFVLKMPTKIDGRTVSFDFDDRRKNFKQSRSNSPVQVFYSKKNGSESQCSISSFGRDTPFEHYYCEIDDVVLHQLAQLLKIPVITNDKGLGRNIAKGSTPQIGRAHV